MSTFVNGYALLIGVGESAYPQWSLPVTVKDVYAIQKVLTNPSLCGYCNDSQHIRVLHDISATKDKISDGLNWLKSQIVNDSEATVIVYYSGHGWLNQTTDQYYLVPHDVKPYNIPDSAFAAIEFITALREIKARRLSVFVDCCHAEGMANAKNVMNLELPSDFAQIALPKNLIETLKQGEGRAVFTSSRGNQLSWIRSDETMSIYTYHLIEALKGANNIPGDTMVRISNLMNHLSKTVPESVRKLCPSLTEQQRKFCELGQTPFFDYATEDFPIALLCGGKGIPHKGDEKESVNSDKKNQHVENIDKRSGGVYFGNQGSVYIRGDVVGRGQTKKGD